MKEGKPHRGHEEGEGEGEGEGEAEGEGEGEKQQREKKRVDNLWESFKQDSAVTMTGRPVLAGESGDPPAKQKGDQPPGPVSSKARCTVTSVCSFELGVPPINRHVNQCQCCVILSTHYVSPLHTHHSIHSVTN